MSAFIIVLICMPIVCSILVLSCCMLSSRISRTEESPLPVAPRGEEAPVMLAVSLSPR